MSKRTAMQCQARGCDGCVVCDTENNGGPEALVEYRRREEALINFCKDKLKSDFMSDTKKKRR